MSPFTKELVSYTHSEAVADIRYGRDALLARYGPHATIADIDIQQLAIDLDGLNDPWGNSYKLVMRQDAECDNPEFSVHLYSKGEDGISRTDGDDPDDLNTWSNDYGQFYWRRIQREQRLKHAAEATVCSPIVFAIMVVLTRIARNTFGDSEPNERTDRIGDEP
ncbi:hypothetical protein [Roseiconus lacunae]|nr:hypothetical protein [Roseiconus lacunae]